MAQAGKNFVKPESEFVRAVLYRAADMGTVKRPVIHIWVARRAGAKWDNSSNCGSRARNANNSLVNANSNVGSRAAIPIIQFAELHRAERFSLVMPRMTKIYNATHPMLVARAKIRGAQL